MAGEKLRLGDNPMQCEALRDIERTLGATGQKLTALRDRKPAPGEKLTEPQ